MVKNNEKTNEKVASSSLLNSLRAAVLGANDGIISTAAVVMGAAGVSGDRTTIVTAGFAALVAGAFSMAVGEYVSVSSQSDAEKTYIDREKRNLINHPEREFEKLTASYQERGLSRKTAQAVAQELTEADAVKAHLEAKHGLSEDDINNPIQAAIASFLAFTVGGLVPFLAIFLSDGSTRIAATLIATVFALGLTGYISARVTDAAPLRATFRIVIGGIIAMVVTYAIGKAFGVAIA